MHPAALAGAAVGADIDVVFGLALQALEGVARAADSRRRGGGQGGLVQRRLADNHLVVGHRGIGVAPAGGHADALGRQRQAARRGAGLGLQGDHPVAVDGGVGGAHAHRVGPHLQVAAQVVEVAVAAARADGDVPRSGGLVLHAGRGAGAQAEGARQGAEVGGVVDRQGHRAGHLVDDRRTAAHRVAADGESRDGVGVAQGGQALGQRELGGVGGVDLGRHAEGVVGVGLEARDGGKHRVGVHRAVADARGGDGILHCAVAALDEPCLGGRAAALDPLQLGAVGAGVGAGVVQLLRLLAGQAAAQSDVVQIDAHGAARGLLEEDGHVAVSAGHAVEDALILLVAVACDGQLALVVEGGAVGGVAHGADLHRRRAGAAARAAPDHQLHPAHGQGGHVDLRQHRDHRVGVGVGDSQRVVERVAAGAAVAVVDVGVVAVGALAEAVVALPAVGQGVARGGGHLVALEAAVVGQVGQRDGGAGGAEAHRSRPAAAAVVAGAGGHDVVEVGRVAAQAAEGGAAVGRDGGRQRVAHAGALLPVAEGVARRGADGGVGRGMQGGRGAGDAVGGQQGGHAARLECAEGGGLPGTGVVGVAVGAHVDRVALVGRETRQLLLEGADQLRCGGVALGGRHLDAVDNLPLGLAAGGVPAHMGRPRRHVAHHHVGDVAAGIRILLIAELHLRQEVLHTASRA